jgi:hypothetical protein
MHLFDCFHVFAFLFVFSLDDLDAFSQMFRGKTKQNKIRVKLKSKTDEGKCNYGNCQINESLVATRLIPSPEECSGFARGLPVDNECQVLIYKNKLYQNLGFYQ